MSEVTLEERGRALENQFYDKENHDKLAAMKEKLDSQGSKDELRKASGMTDDAVLEKLVALGLRGNTIAALSLVPLIQVAWADGTDPGQRAHRDPAGRARQGPREGHAGLRAARDVAAEAPVRRADRGVGGVHQGARVAAQRRAEPAAQESDRRVREDGRGGGGRLSRHRPRVGVGGEGAAAGSKRRSSADGCSCCACSAGPASRSRASRSARCRSAATPTSATAHGDLARRARRRRQLHRHRGRLQRGPLRGDRRPAHAAASATSSCSRPRRTFRPGTGPNARGASRFHLVRAVEASLRRLATDRIDLYLPAPLRRRDRSRRDAARARRPRAHRQDPVPRVLELRGVAGRARARRSRRAHGLAPFVAIQPMYNLVKRTAEIELLPMARSLGLAVVPYSPTGGGLLTGKYGAGKRPERGRLARHEDVRGRATATRRTSRSPSGSARSPPSSASRRRRSRSRGSRRIRP